MALLDNFVGGVKSFMTGTGGAGINDDWFGTPYGSNTIPEATLTKAQKTFSTKDVNPNFPKPKTLYFVYFHLNPALESRIQYKNKFIKTLIENGNKDGMTVNRDSLNNVSAEVYSQLKSTLDKTYDSKKTSNILLNNNELADKGLATVNETIKDYTAETASLDFIPTHDMFKTLSFEISKLVKNYDKPSVTFDTAEFNEYNRKRHIYTGVKYNDINISFYDVKESPVQQFFIAYLKFICGDFFCKSAGVWERPIENNHWQNSEGYKTVDGQSIKGTYYGNLNSFGLNIDSNFRLIDRISFCEYYMDKLTVYTIENPIITSIKFGEGRMGDFGSNDLTITFKYEGVHNDLVDIEQSIGYNKDKSTKTLFGYIKSVWDKAKNKDKRDEISKPIELKCMINHSIKADVSNFIQTRYKNLGGSIASDVVSILKGYMNGDVKFSWNTVKNQALDTMRKYNMAGAANTAAQAEQTIKNYNSKDGAGKAKYLVNMSTDPTSLIGKATTGSVSGRGSNSGFFF